MHQTTGLPLEQNGQGVIAAPVSRAAGHHVFLRHKVRGTLPHMMGCGRSPACPAPLANDRRGGLRLRGHVDQLRLRLKLPLPIPRLYQPVAEVPV